MPILTDKLAFVAMPKTGSTFVFNVLMANGLSPRIPLKNGSPTRHLSLLDEWCADQCRDRFIFTMVRHPVDWITSVWMHLKKHDQTGKLIQGDFFQGPVGRFSRYYKPTFPATIAAMVDADPHFVNKVYHAYAEDADFVGRTEDLPSSLGAALDMAGHKAVSLANVAIANVSNDELKDLAVMPAHLERKFRQENAWAFGRFKYDLEVASHGTTSD